MAVSVPNHSNWKTFKGKYGVPAGAVSGINVGKELDTYHNGLKQAKFMDNAKLAAALEKKLADYLKKLDKKKVTKLTYDGFKKEFTEKYVLMANAAEEEYKAMGGDLGAFTERLSKCIVNGMKLKAGIALAPLQTYRSGEVRGLLAAATRVKGVDIADIKQLWDTIDNTINNLGKDDTQVTLDKVVALVHVTAKKSKEVESAKGLKV